MAENVADDQAQNVTVPETEELTAFEAALVAAAVAGQGLDPTNGQDIDVSLGAQWGPERTVRAKVLEELITGRYGNVHRRGVRLRGARIRGTLDLSWAQAPSPVSLARSYFDEPVRANNAAFAQLVLTGSRIPALNLERTSIKGDLFLNDGFTATSQIRLPSVRCTLFAWDDELVTGVRDLQGATVEQLNDRWVRPIKRRGGAILNGFRYESFGEGTDDSLPARLAWIRSSPGYAPQPYTQLAAVYRRAGHDDRARQILIKREIDRRKRVRNSCLREQEACSWEQRSRTGTSPARAALFVIVLVLTGVALLFWTAGP